MQFLRDLCDYSFEINMILDDIFQVPFRKVAFFPGRLIHTNEFMVMPCIFYLAFCRDFRFFMYGFEFMWAFDMPNFSYLMGFFADYA